MASVPLMSDQDVELGELPSYKDVGAPSIDHKRPGLATNSRTPAASGSTNGAFRTEDAAKALTSGSASFGSIFGKRGSAAFASDEHENSNAVVFANLAIRLGNIP